MESFKSPVDMLGVACAPTSMALASPTGDAAAGATAPSASTAAATSFLELLSDLVEMLLHEALLRFLGYRAVILCFVRLLVYVRTHPRIAILYTTVEVGSTTWPTYWSSS